MSRKNSQRRVLSAALAVLLCMTCTPAAAFAEESPAETDSAAASNSSEDEISEEQKAAFYTEQKTYSDYYDEHSADNYPDREVPLTYVGASEETEVTQGSYEGKDDVLVWSNQEGQLDFTVDVPESGNYNIKITYYPISSKMTSSEVSILLDNESPYDAATRVGLSKRWHSDTEITKDSKGNELRPIQSEDPRWVTTYVNDPDGIFSAPLIFNLEKGTHTISLASEKASVAIASIELCGYETPEAYTAPSDSDLRANQGAATIKVQGENYTYTSSSEIFPTYDRGDYRTEDHVGDYSDPVKQRYNSMGEGTWDTAGQQVTWTIEVPQDGYYKLGIKGRQNVMRGLYSNRRVYIDGVVPNSAFDDVKFYYDNDWQVSSPTDENGDDAYVYLTAGTHELTLEAIPGEIGEYMRRLDKVVTEVNNYYLKILMITGPSPDKYTDYYVHKEIPELLDDFERLAAELREIQSEIEALSNQKGSEAAALERLATVLDYCIKKPNKIPTQISNGAIKDNVSSVSSWMRTYREQPLEIDYIELTPAYDASGKESEFTSLKKNFFKSISFGASSFFGSFFEDYTVLSDTSENSINVWSSLGRDQTNVVKQMVDSQFNGNYGVDVAINLVQGGIMEAVLAGKGPDVAIFIGGEYPVNLAIRGLLYPINDMDGYDEVAARYHESALVPYTYNDQVYCVPLTRNFPMMFYRKDMLSEIGIYEYPETWNDLIDMLPAFQRNYMQPGLILPANVNGTSISPATEEGHTFALLMLQSGLNYYNDEQTETTFNSQEAVEAFDIWTKFYTTYGFDQTYDAFTRFRTGEAPVVIQDYCTFYNQLNTAAPEIKGLWDFAPVPGTLRDDGTVSHAANSSSAGAMILTSCKNPEAAWTFLKWFSDTDQMVEYATNVEGVMGSLGRVAPADPEALKQLNWSKSDLEKIMTEMDQLDEIPIIPSSYVVTRGVMNAFRAVVNDHDNARETLRWYNKDINSEITRKRKNLGLDTDDTE